MRKQIIFLLIIISMVVGQAACGPSKADLQATEAADQAKAQETQRAKTTLQAQFTANAVATNNVKETRTALKTNQVVGTSTQAISLAGTAEVEETSISAGTATALSAIVATEKAQSRQTATAEAIVKATTAAMPMLSFVSDLASNGYLSEISSQGEYVRLLDFDQSWAQITYYKAFPTGYAPTDFVVRAHAEWDAAIRTPDPSGCGFTFRENGDANHYLTFLATDGNVYFSRYVKGNWALVGSNFYGPVGVPKGEADIALAVEGSWVTFFVNGELVMRRQDTALATGNLNYTLISGTNKDYGTNCRMTNIDLWIIQ